MTISKAHGIAMIFSGRVARILLASGYQTNIGARVLRGRRTLNARTEDSPGDMPCVVMIEGEDLVPDEAILDAKVTQRFIFEGHRELTLLEIDNPNDVAHMIVADLKKAIFGDTTDRDYGGKIRKGDVRYKGKNIGLRDDGQAFVCASIEIDVTFTEQLSSP